MKKVKPNKNLRSVNLNALPVLREILRHGSLTKAAEALNLSQPALSNMLKQLRIDFGDELIVRRGREMQLTPRGAKVMAPLEDTLASIEGLLSGDNFSAQTATQTVRIVAADYVFDLVGARLVQILQDEAPELRVHMMGAHPGSVSDLMAGTIDMIITPKLLISSGLADAAAVAAASFEPLWCEPMVCIGRADDDALAAGLSEQDYLVRPHIGFSIDARLYGGVEQAQLARLVLRQFDRLVASSYLVLPKIVAATGSLALIPQSLALRAAELYPIQMVHPPIEAPDMELVMGWHRRDDHNPVLRWLRAALIRCVPQDG